MFPFNIGYNLLQDAVKHTCFMVLTMEPEYLSSTCMCVFLAHCCRTGVWSYFVPIIMLFSMTMEMVNIDSYHSIKGQLDIHKNVIRLHTLHCKLKIETT